VVASDLRGYGDSGRPPDGENHFGYSKRATAADQVRVMASLGFERFRLVGHDRGGRVSHRLALDHPGAVERLSVLDIVPTRTLFKATDQFLATAYYHWFFLIQVEPFPETLIGNDPEFYLDFLMRRWAGASEAFTDEAFAEYLRCFSKPETIHATCEDYRAAATIDLEHDEADLGTKIACPMQALWGAKAVMEKTFDVVGEWRKSAEQVEGQAIPCGHFMPEEAPEETLAALLAFLAP
jgi:haloacetate dehalogenase